MQPRIDIAANLNSSLGRALFSLSNQSEASGLDHRLRELVKIRASQLNQCAYCIDMHTKDARAAGESEQRIYALSAWREAPFYSDAERVALEWAEALTLLPSNSVPEELYDRVSSHFDETALVELTFAVIVINAWNRIAVPFRAPVGTYQPRKVAV